MIGHTFNATFSYYVIDENGDDKTEKKSSSFKIVGLYDSSSIGEDHNLCYIGGKEFEEITSDMNKGSDDRAIYDIKIIVDDSNNLEYVKKELAKLNLRSDRILIYDNDKVNFVNNISFGIIMIILIVTIVFSELYVKKKIVKNKNNIKLLYCLGYSKRNITNLYLLAIIVISCLMFCIGFVIVRNLYQYIPFEISNINIMSIIISIIIMLIIPVFVYELSMNKLLSKNKFIVGGKE